MGQTEIDKERQRDIDQSERGRETEIDRPECVSDRSPPLSLSLSLSLFSLSLSLSLSRRGSRSLERGGVGCG